MTQEEFILKQKAIIQHLKDGVIMGIATADTHAKMSARIFEEGKTATGGDIGQYGGGPLYINPNRSPKKFPVKGKPDSKGKGDTKFENGKEHKTGYFESYKAYREKIGRQTGKVDLVLSGSLQSDFSNGLIKKDDFTYNVSVKNVKNRKIIEGVQEKYGNVFSPSQQESENFKDVFNFEVQRLIKGA